MVSRKHDDDDDATDDALLARYAAGDMRAAAILTRRLGDRVLAHAHHRLQNRADAEEIMQEAFLRLWRIAPEWQPGKARVTTWLWRVTENLAIDRLRKRREAPLDDAAMAVADSATDAGERADHRKRMAALYQAIAALPQRQQQAIHLRHLQEYSNPEIAEHMALSVEAVESLLARGRRKLNTLLRQHGEDLGYGNG